MRTRALLLAASATALLLGAIPVKAQFSSNIPGVPRASLPFFGNSQGRFEFDLTGFKLPGTEEQGDSVGGRVRIGFGKSWRIASALEFGFDVSLAEGSFRRIPTDSVSAENRIVASGGYGLRFGLKFTPIQYLSPEGHGFSVAVGASFQPSLEPAVTYFKQGDTEVKGGAVGSDDDDAPTKIHSATQIMLAVSYSNERLTADAALVTESVDSTGSSPLVVYEGMSPRIGVKYRLTGGFSLGAAYWGSGAPPWRDRLAAGVGATREQRFGVLLGFGSTPGKGTDLMISSPTGSFGEAVNFYWRIR